MARYKPRVISLTKRPGQTFGFYLRVEHGEEGQLIRCLEMGGPAELAGMKDGDRILRVNKTFVDELSHSEVVDLVRNSGASVVFHILDESSYKEAKAQGVDFSKPQSTPLSKEVAKQALKPKLCYLVKSSSGFGFSLRSVKGEKGLFTTDVIPGSVADKAGIKFNDRLLELNGENVESCTHDQMVAKIKLAGSSLMFLLVDEEADRFYQSKQAKIGSWLATAKYLSHKPRLINVTKGSDGYGFLLREEPNKTGHFIKDIDRKSPAERAGLQEMDRLVAVDGQEVESCSHNQVVDRIRQSGNNCCLLVVDKDTDLIYKQGKLSPMLFWEEMKGSNSPPSYTEALNLPAPVHPSTAVHEQEEALKPKLCKMEKTAAGYGFHLNGIQGLGGQFIMEVVKGGAADRAGMEDNDIVVEVDGVNVEQSGHEEVVALIRSSGSSLEMLLAKKSVYQQLKAKGVAITRLLLGETSYVQVHTAATPETSEEKEKKEKEKKEKEKKEKEKKEKEKKEKEEKEKEKKEKEKKEKEEKEKKEEVRPETPAEPERQRTSSVSSSSSDNSLDMRL
ncbi:Na(+)/H(+) exchange regulatory cofactor NHE-RF3 isoform X1 [Brachyistius frenatus]|uniref:Na(+)/H(+) exchange regulatory cofactor NHE-RF3 isoform X1 n=1 Tax=Brachyistius frenatus TaxID=100188 RepID=UPI0037E8D718